MLLLKVSCNCSYVNSLIWCHHNRNYLLNSVEDSSALSASPSPSVSDLKRSCPLGLLLISKDPVKKQRTIFYAQKRCLVPLEAWRGVRSPTLGHSRPRTSPDVEKHFFMISKDHVPLASSWSQRSCGETLLCRVSLEAGTEVKALTLVIQDHGWSTGHLDHNRP